jgi:hypothetical protein
MKTTKQRFFLFLSILPFFTTAQQSSFTTPQHCPFDNMCIIVVNPMDLQSRRIIDDLTISLQDSSGNVLKNWDDSPLIFKRNPPKTDPKWAPFNLMAIRYSFAKDYYIRTLTCSKGDSGEDIYLVLEDSSMTRQTHYKKLVLKLDKKYFYSLHDNVGKWTSIASQQETPAPQEPFTKRMMIGLSPEEPSSAGEKH